MVLQMKSCNYPRTFWVTKLIRNHQDIYIFIHRDLRLHRWPSHRFQDFSHGADAKTWTLQEASDHFATWYWYSWHSCHVPLAQSSVGLYRLYWCFLFASWQGRIQGPDLIAQSLHCVADWLITSILFATRNRTFLLIQFLDRNGREKRWHMIKPCAKARLLGQTRKPNTDWKPNYGLLTRLAWMFRGNLWDMGRNDGHFCFIEQKTMMSLSWMWWLPRSQRSKWLSSTFRKMPSWLSWPKSSMHRLPVLDLCFLLRQQGSECGYLTRRDPILLDSTGQAKAPPFDSATALGAGHGDNPIAFNDIYIYDYIIQHSTI